jgi:hypothetical protein
MHGGTLSIATLTIMTSMLALSSALPQHYENHGSPNLAVLEAIPEYITTAKAQVVSPISYIAVPSNVGSERKSVHVASGSAKTLKPRPNFQSTSRKEAQFEIAAPEATDDAKISSPDNEDDDGNVENAAPHRHYVDGIEFAKVNAADYVPDGGAEGVNVGPECQDDSESCHHEKALIAAGDHQTRGKRFRYKKKKEEERWRRNNSNRRTRRKIKM